VIGWKILSTKSVDNFVDIFAAVVQKPTFTNQRDFV